VLLLAASAPAWHYEGGVGLWVGQHAPQELGTGDVGFAWGARLRLRWTEGWAVELFGGHHPEGIAADLAVERFIGSPSADLVAHVSAGFGIQADRAEFLAVGAGFDVVLTRWLDLRPDGRFELATDGSTALLFTISPILHTPRSFDVDRDGVTDRADACPTVAEDADGWLDTDGCPDLDDDQDGLPDLGDACPRVPEDPDGVQDRDGCLDPDNDGDGVFDQLDACPNLAEDEDGHDDADGCPDDDNDHDLVLDLADACDDVGEDIDGFEDDDGCPEPDNDADGVADAWDAAPLQPETYNGWQDGDGAPDAIPRVIERLLGPFPVTFALEEGRLQPRGEYLERLADVLSSFPEARLELVVSAHEPEVAQARAAALTEALAEAHDQIVVRTAEGHDGVILQVPPP
jgi:hypothetical protein